MGFNDTSGWFLQKRLGENHAGAKIIAGKDRQFLDAHMFGPDYAELINVLSLAIKLGLTAARVRAMPVAYPIGTSDIGSLS